MDENYKKKRTYTVQRARARARAESIRRIANVRERERDEKSIQRPKSN